MIFLLLILFGLSAISMIQADETALADPVETGNLYAVNIDDGAQVAHCRTIPFLACDPDKRQSTRRIIDRATETIPVHAQADTLYLLGLINHGWDWGLCHWGEHSELHKFEDRDDQIYLGKKIGEIDIRYEDGRVDRLPLVFGATAWYFTYWHGPTYGVPTDCKEPFASRPELRAVLDQSLRLREEPKEGCFYTHYYLAVKPRSKPIASITVRNNTAVRGRPLVSAVTLATSKPVPELHPFGPRMCSKADLEPAFDIRRMPDFVKDSQKVANALYMSEDDLPKRVELLNFPEALDATQIRFIGGVKGDMLTNVWTQNLTLINEKCSPETGMFWESVPKIGPWYSGYTGFGTWGPAGAHYGDGQAFARTADHYVTLAMRNLGNLQRMSSFCDFVDYWLYVYRHDHDPANGPPNDELDLKKYPDNAYPSWSYIIQRPLWMPEGPVDPVPGKQETCGHGSVMVARWFAWRHLGAPTGDWLTAPRNNVFGKSRWDSTFDAAEFICWYMDYTGMDVMFDEGEATGWGQSALVPQRFANASTPEEIRRGYANSYMYPVVSTWICNVALRCSAQMAEAKNKPELAERWNAYAVRLKDGMGRLLKCGDYKSFAWRVNPYSTWSTPQDTLAQAWFSIYLDGYDPQRWDQDLTSITRNTLKRQLNQPYGHAPVLGFGYGLGWLAKSALLLDAMDDASELLWNIAKYSYDKNMDYVDPKRGIDWRRWLYIIPEGTHTLPTGQWYRLGDLSNGANQGPPLHALEVCAGVDDTSPEALKILPRVPDPLTGIEIKNHYTLVKHAQGLERVRLNYRYDRDGVFKLTANQSLPTLAVRLGPFTKDEAQAAHDRLEAPQCSTLRLETSGSYHEGPAWWLWVEGLTNVTNLKLDFRP
jgi:hypothetical protein